jgi:hypothetical protein
MARRVGLGLVLLASAQVSASATVQTAASQGASPRIQTIARPATPAPPYIRDQVQQLGRAFNGRVGIAVRSVDDNWSTGWKADELYPQQSVSKLWVSITALDAVDRGRVRLDDKVTLINTMSNERLDVAGVSAKFGVPPGKIVDYLALIGDSVDNIPGVDKVGPKTAAKWIQEHGSLEGVIAAAPQMKGVVGENLRKALDWLPQGRRLVTVVTDCDLSGHVLGWPEFDALALREIDVDGLLAFYDRYGFGSMRKELENALGRTPSSRSPAAPARSAAIDVPDAVPSQAIVKRYEDLRHAGRVPEAIKARLRTPGEEYTLSGSVDGVWQFRPAQYAKHKVESPEPWRSVW